MLEHSRAWSGMVRCGVRVSFEFSFRLIRPFVRLSKVVPMLICEVCPRKDKRGVDLISNALLFGWLYYGGANVVGYAHHYSRSEDAVIRVYDTTGNCRAGDFDQSALSLFIQPRLTLRSP